MTGELAPVMRGYQEQFTSAGFGGEGLRGDGSVMYVITDSGGAGTMSAVAVPGDPAYVLLERIND